MSSCYDCEYWTRNTRPGRLWGECDKYPSCKDSLIDTDYMDMEPSPTAGRETRESYRCDLYEKRSKG